MNDQNLDRAFPPLPLFRRRIRADRWAARQNDLLRARLADALRRSGRYLVVSNMRVALTAESRRLVRRASGGYLGVSLPHGGDLPSGGAVVDMVVIDESYAWAGAYAFCWRGAQSALVRRHVETALRRIELVLRSHLRSLGYPVSTATVGIIDGGAEADQADDLTISLSEIGDHFDLPLRILDPRWVKPTAG